MTAGLDQLAAVVLGDVEQAQTALATAQDRLDALHTGLVALMEQTDGGAW